MPDISKCDNEKCKRKQTCYRYTAKPNPYMQTYGKFEAKDCEYYWEVEK